MPKLFCAICQEWPNKLQRRCFSFPSQPYYRRQWLAACRLAAVPASAGVCEGHFTPADFNDDSESKARKRLKTSVVPKINLPSPSEAEANVEATAGQVDIEDPGSRRQAPCCPCRCHAAAGASMTPKQKRRKLVTSTPRDATLHDADDACDYTDYVFVFDSTGDEDHEMARNNEGKYEKTVRVYNRVRDTFHPRSGKAPIKDPHVRRPSEAVDRLKHRTTVEGEVHREGDPRSPFPYVHRGANERETKEALLASRYARTRLTGVAAASHDEAAASHGEAAVSRCEAAASHDEAAASHGEAAVSRCEAAAFHGEAAAPVDVATAAVATASDDVADSPVAVAAGSAAAAAVPHAETAASNRVAAVSDDGKAAAPAVNELAVPA